MTKIKQVARALQAAKIGGQRIRFSDEYAILLARAAIEAMREPTKVMESAAHDEMQEFGLGRYTPIANAYRAMIDAALQEQEQG